MEGVSKVKSGYRGRLGDNTRVDNRWKTKCSGEDGRARSS